MKTEVLWIQGIPTGRLGIAPRPRGGDWLDNEVQAWRAAGVNCVVSALTHPEEAELDLESEASVCRNYGLRFASLPIPDRGVPGNSSAMGRLLTLVVENLESGKGVVIHCRQGIGRSSLIAASILVALGENPERAFSRIERARGRPVPDTEEQRVWVRRFANSFRSSHPRRRLYRRIVAHEVHA